MSFFSQIIDKFRRPKITDFDSAIYQYNEFTKQIFNPKIKEKRKELCLKFLTNPEIQAQDKIDFILNINNTEDFEPKLLLDIIPYSYFIGQTNKDISKIASLLFDNQYYDIYFELRTKTKNLHIADLINDFVSLESRPETQKKYAYSLLEKYKNNYFIKSNPFKFPVNNEQINYNNNEIYYAPYFLLDYFLKFHDYKSMVELLLSIKQSKFSKSHLENNNIYSLSTHYIYKTKLVFNTEFIKQLKKQDATLLLAKSNRHNNRYNYSGNIFEALTESYFIYKESPKLTEQEIRYLNNIDFTNNSEVTARDLLLAIPKAQLQTHFTEIFNFILQNKYHLSPKEKSNLYHFFVDNIKFTPDFKNMLCLLDHLHKNKLLENEDIKSIYNKPFGVSDIKDPYKQNYDDFFKQNYNWKESHFLNQRYYQGLSFNYFMDDLNITFSQKIEKLIDFYFNDTTFHLSDTTPSYYLNIFLEMPLIIQVNNDFEDINKGLLSVKEAFKTNNISHVYFKQNMNKFFFYQQTIRQECPMIDFISIKLDQYENKEEIFSEFIQKLEIDPGKQYLGDDSLISKIYNQSQKEFIINYAVEFEKKAIEKTFNIDNTSFKNKHKQRL